MQPNWENGFSRLTWLLSSIGLLMLVIGLPWTAVNLSGRASLMSKIESEFHLYNLSYEEKELLVERVKLDYPLMSEAAWYSSPLLLTIFGGCWFLSLWVVFWLIKWLIKGFLK